MGAPEDSMCDVFGALGHGVSNTGNPTGDSTEGIADLGGGSVGSVAGAEEESAGTSSLLLSL